MKNISVSDRAYAWSSETKKPAPWPKFNPKAINVKNFLEEERPKELSAWIDGNEGHVEWLARGSDSPSSAFIAEVKRAFKANGLKPGSIIHLKYGMRDYGLHDEGDLVI